MTEFDPEHPELDEDEVPLEAAEADVAEQRTQLPDPDVQPE